MKSCLMCRWDVRRVVPDVQKGRNAFIVKSSTVWLNFEDESIFILRNVKNYSPSDTASQDLIVQHHRYKNVKSRKIVSFFRTRNFSLAHFCLVTNSCVVC